MAKSPFSEKWVLALEALALVASPVISTGARADVYLFCFPRGTRKAEQVTAGRLWPGKSLDGRTLKAPEAAASKPCQRCL